LHRCGVCTDGFGWIGAGDGEAGGEPGGAMAGSWREGWQGYTPLFACMVGTISRFGLQKFFFGFRVGWAVSIG